MKQKSPLLLFFFLIFSLNTLSAQDFLVTYMDGRADLKAGNAWQPLKLGARLSDASVVRLGDKSLLECRRTGAVITISRPGIYALKDLTRPAARLRTGNPLASIDKKIRQVAGDEEGRRRKYAAMGVRGRAIDDDSGPEFVDSEPFDPVAPGVDLLDEGQYDQAVAYFKDELKNSPDQATEAILAYYLVYAYNRNNQNALALKQADQMDIPPQHALYPDYVLLKGRLLYMSFDYDGALALFNTYLSHQPRGDAAQPALLLSAYCYQGKGDKIQQKEVLQKAVTLDPQSDVGREAAELLKKL